MAMGKFITFEGGDGSGKTTLMARMANYLRDDGYRVQTTHDPGGAPIASGLRPFLLDKTFAISKEAEFLLYLAARAELVNKTIIPMLPHVDFLLCDRYFDSTEVYQGMIRGWGDLWAYEDETFLRFMHRVFCQDVIPNYTFLFDVKPEIGLSRSKGIELNEGRWEEEGLEIHAKINNGFRWLAELEEDRIIVIDANMEIDEVFDDLVMAFHAEVLEEG